MIKGWYGNILHEDEEHRSFMLDSSHVFEMYGDELINASNAIKKIQKKYPRNTIYPDSILEINHYLQNLGNIFQEWN